MNKNKHVMTKFGLIGLIITGIVLLVLAIGAAAYHSTSQAIDLTAIPGAAGPFD